MGTLAIVGGSDVLDAAGVGGELETLPKRATGAVLGIIDCDALAAIAGHDGEAGDIGRAVADVDHVFKRNRPLLGGHVVVHILVVTKHALVDAEEELRLGGVGNGALGEADAAFRVFAEFAAEHGFHIGLQTRAV